MKKKILVVLAIVFLLLVGMYWLGSSQPSPSDANTPAADMPVTAGSYTGSWHMGNYVYGGAMNLAWNDLTDSIIHEPIKLNTTNAAALATTVALNKKTFTTNDLDAASYYIKSGYGQKTVQAINTESRKKFPTKSFDDLDIKLRDIDLIAYAYFLKQVSYPVEFSQNNLDFHSAPNRFESVLSFSAESAKQKENVRIIKYWNDDKFIISLKLKDDGDRLLVAKGFPMQNPQAVLEEMNRHEADNFETLDSEDIFEMPKLHLDYHRDYKEMLGKQLANAKFADYIFAAMFENIKFDMDETGARVENEAVIAMSGAYPGYVPPPVKHFILDKPFWVVMKRTASSHPYFILGVQNTELMLLERI